MIGRRAFLWFMTGMMASAQTGIVQKGKAVVCEGDALKCPIGHNTCKEIDAPIAVGNDSSQNPEVAQLRKYRVYMCTFPGCGALFCRKQEGYYGG